MGLRAMGGTQQLRRRLDYALIFHDNRRRGYVLEMAAAEGNLGRSPQLPDAVASSGPLAGFILWLFKCRNSSSSRWDSLRS